MTRKLSMAIGLVAAFFSGSTLLAQPMADRVPADSIAYFGWQGTENVPGYAGSHFEAIIKESNIPVVFRQVLPQVIARVGKEDRDAGDALQLAYELLSPVAKYPTALFFEGIKFDGDRPMPQLGLVCRAGADAATLEEKLKGVLAKAGEIEVPVKVVVSGQDVAVLIGYAPDEMALAGDGTGRPGALAGDAGFKSALSKVKADPVVAFHINFEAVFALVDGVVERQGNEQGRVMYEKVIDAVGVRGLKRVIVTSGFDGKDWMEQAYMEAPSPRKGILKMLESPAIGDDLLKAIPATAEAFVGGTFDIGRFVAEIRTIVGEIDKNAQKQFDQAIGGATMAVGRNFQTEVLDPLGPNWVVYSAPEIAGGGLPGLVVINKPKDAAKAKGGLMALSIFASNSAASALAMNDAPVTVTGRQVKYGDLAINYLATPLVTPCWSVQGDYLIAGLYPQSIIGASRQIAGGKGLLIDSAEYKALRARLGVEKVHGITYANLPKSAPQGYQFLLVLSRVVGFADLFGIQSPPIVIPPYHVLQEHLSVAGGVNWVEEDGVHMKRVAPFPGAELLQGGGAGVLAVIAPAAVAAGVVAPAMGKAREHAIEVKSMSNLRQLSMCVIMHANDNQGMLPSDLQSAAKYGGDHMDQLLDSPLGDAPDGADYVYLGNDGIAISKIKRPSEVIIIYDAAAKSGFRATPVVYADGHAEMKPPFEVDAEIEASKAALEEAKGN